MRERLIISTVILYTFTTDTNRTVGTCCPQIRSTRCTTISAIRQGINTTYCIGCITGTDIYKTIHTLITAITIFTLVRNRIRNGMTDASIVTGTTMIRITAVDIFTDIFAIDDT